MFQKSRRISASLVALVMAMSISSTAFADETTSSVKNHWASEIMQRWVDYGIIKGSDSGDLRPDASITRAEVATIINNAFGFVTKSNTQFSDVKTDSWYADEMLKARAAGYYKGFPGNLSNADTKITRQDAAVIISNVFGIDGSDNKLLSGSFKDSNDIANYALNAVNKLSTDGIIKGYSDGKFQPKANITRAEFIAIMDKLAKLFNKSGIQGFSDISSNAIINAASAELKNAKVDKNLYITESVGNGSVTLNNVTVAGSVYISGGKDSINIADTTINQLVVSSKNAKVLVTGKSKIKNLIINTEASIVENPIISDVYKIEKVTISNTVLKNQAVSLNGNFTEVNILSDGVISFESGSIEKLQVSLPENSAKPTINMASTVVSKFIANDPVDLKVDSYAKVNLEINSDNVSINGKTAVKGPAVVDKGTLKQSTTQTVEEIPAVPNDSKSSSSGSSGGGGGSGSSKGSSGGGGGGSGKTGGSTPKTPKGPETVIKEFDFRKNLQDWVHAKTVNATFGTPEIEYTKDLDGALKINANITDPQQAVQQLQVAVDGLTFTKANAVTFDMFLDSSLINMESYGNCIIKPSIILEPEAIEISSGFNDDVLKNWTEVTINEKQYRKYTVKNVINAPNATKLTIVFESSKLSYIGPIYIDNVKISNFTGPVDNAPASDPAPITNKSIISTDAFNKTIAGLSDYNATEETASLFAYLKGVGGNKLLFGQQQATIGSSESDFKNAVGANPAVYELNYSAEDLKNSVKSYKENGIISITADMPNFASTDTSGDVVKSILPGGSKNTEYNNYLDDIAKFANSVKKPIIFRLFRETEKGEFWWESCSDVEYIKLYRYTVDYLRDVGKVHNFLYVYSRSTTNRDEFYKRYPGKPYVDILGLNLYNDNSEEAINKCQSFINSLDNSEKDKVFALTEVGPNNSFTIKNNKNKNWFTNMIKKVNDTHVAISYAVVGTNSSINKISVPYRNHFLLGNHEMLQDFVNFYNNETVAFENSLDENVYSLSVTRDSEEPYVFISSPIDGDTLNGELTITAKVFPNNATVEKVTFSVTDESSIDFSPNENNEYKHTFTPSSNKGKITIKVVVYLEDDILYSSIKVNNTQTNP